MERGGVLRVLFSKTLLRFYSFLRHVLVNTILFKRLS